MAIKQGASEEFTYLIEQRVKKGLTYMEAILEFCEKMNFEPSQITHLISPKLKLQLYEEAKALHFLPKENSLF